MPWPATPSVSCIRHLQRCRLSGISWSPLPRLLVDRIIRYVFIAAYFGRRMAGFLEGIDQGIHRELGSMERWFFWLSLGRSGDLAPERGVLHAEEDAADAPLCEDQRKSAYVA